MQNDILQQLKEAEQKFKINDYKGNSLCSCTVKKCGNLPILLSAPHAVKQIRKGQIKAHEFYTGAIAECLAKQLGYAYIAKQYLIENSASDDPNSDNAYCSYKTAVNQFLHDHDIKLFVDIHGLSGKRDSFIDIEIDGGKNINDMSLATALQKCVENKFGAAKATIDKYFQASPETVMSKWVHTTFGISAFELEINGACRWFEGDTAQQSLDMFFCLAQWLKNLSL